MKCFILLGIVVFQYVASVSGVDPIVNTKVGQIRGLQAEDGDYSMFLGIPFGKVDKNNPFGPSTPYPIFEEPFEAHDDTAQCPQMVGLDTVSGTLDCLHLNVYVPNNAPSNNRFPVMIWIYGGGFTSGSAGRFDFGPKFLVRHDVILVTLNYRLGPYGFMCLDTPSVPGNQGLKDQLMALRWIKNNIDTFGGDTNKITLFGESAGAISTDFHLYSNQEELFNQVILQSGVTLLPNLMVNPRSDGAFKLAEHLGLSTTDIEEAVSFLSKAEMIDVFKAADELNLGFAMCVEKDFENVEKFVTDYPVNLAVPKVKNIPVLIGFTDDEATFFFADVDDNIVNEIVKSAFDFDDNFDDMAGLVKRFYMGDEDESLATKRPLIDINSDFNFVHPARRSIQKYFNNGAETIYSYMFSYVGLRNYARLLMGIDFGGATHADELGYLFDMSFLSWIMPAADQVVVDKMTTLWTNFAKYGDPTPETTDLLPVKWIPVTEDRWNYLNIDSDLSMETRPFRERMAFLDLFYKMNEKYQIGYREQSRK